MDGIVKVLSYLYTSYPRKHELSKSRLTKMVYLADWYSVLKTGQQLTSIKWMFSDCGPFVEDVAIALANSPCFKMRQVTSGQGPRDLVSYDGPRDVPVDATAKSLLDHVIATTVSKSWDDFLRLVYSTYPVLASQRWTALDLPTLAAEYRQQLSIASVQAGPSLATSSATAAQDPDRGTDRS